MLASSSSLCANTYVNVSNTLSLIACCRLGRYPRRQRCSSSNGHWPERVPPPPPPQATTWGWSASHHRDLRQMEIWAGIINTQMCQMTRRSCDMYTCSQIAILERRERWSSCVIGPTHWRWFVLRGNAILRNYETALWTEHIKSEMVIWK